LVFIALSVFNAVDGCGPQFAFNTVPELFLLPIADVSMSLAVALLKIVGRGGQYLRRQIRLLHNPL
jgi:hypothetical protein